MDINIIKKFAKFCQKKLGIETLPKIKLTQSREEIKTTAGYKRGREVIVYTKGRHIVDICRSLAHELKHHKQWEDKLFDDTEKVQDVGGNFEDEANAIAGVLIKQFAYDGNMKIYESKQRLTEGRVEDAKKQFPSISPDLINYISSKDPSGNNKYIKWVLRQLRFQMISNPNLDKKAFVDEIMPKIKQYNDLLPYYGQNMLDSNVLPEKIVKNPKDINNYENIEQLMLSIQMVLPDYLEKQNKKQETKNDVIVLEDDKYIVVSLQTPRDICYYAANMQLCNDIQQPSRLKEYFRKWHFFAVVNKIDNNKIIICVPKEKSNNHVIAYDSSDNVVDLKELKASEPDINNVLLSINLWVESLYDYLAVNIRIDKPELFALTQYLDDDNLKHYKINATTNELPNFNYVSGGVVQKYYVGHVNKIKEVAKNGYIEQLKQYPKVLSKHTYHILPYLNINKLTGLVFNYVGIDGLVQDHSKISQYYHIPPMKLKTSQISDNNGELQRLKQIDNDIESYNYQTKVAQKVIKTITKHLKRTQNTINDLNDKIKALTIRANQITKDPTTYQIVQDKINNYEYMLGQYEKEKTNLSTQVDEYNKKMLSTKEQIDVLSDEYVEIINNLEQTYDDKDNYEYSIEQIKDAKNKIHLDVMSNPVSWMKKMNLNFEDIIDLLNVDAFAESLSEQLIQNIKSFNKYKLKDQINHNGIEYYIFTDNK